MKPADSRRFLESLARNGQLTAAGLEFALNSLGVVPAAAGWRRFADRLLLAAGSLLLLAGVVFFFAFNWSELHRFVKIGMVLVALLLSAGMSLRRGLECIAGQAWLGAGVVLGGVLLAVIGQIYQSGADSELLFAGWAVLTWPWVMVACAPWLWLFWLALVNTALGLFIAGRFDIWALLSDAMFWAPLLLNVLALVCWEFGWSRLAWLRADYGPRFISVLAAAAATGLGTSWWFLGTAERWPVMQYAPLVYLPWLVLTLWFYSQRRRDLVPLATAALSLIVVVTAGLIRALFDHGSSGVGEFFLVGAAVAVMTAGAAFWLRQTATAWEQAGRLDDA